MNKHPRVLRRIRPLKIDNTRKISTASTESRTHFLTKANALRLVLMLASLGLVAFLLGPIGFARKPAAQDRTPQAQSDFIRQFPLVTNDLVFSSSTNLLYASVPSSVGSTGNSIVSVDPATGISDTPVFVGSEPKKMALSSDGNSIYVFLDGSAAVRRFDVPTKTPGAQFGLGQDNFGFFSMTDMAVAPGNPDLVAIARTFRGLSPPEAGTAVFDHGIQRPTTTVGHTAASDFLAFSASPNTLYGGGTFSGLNTMTIDANGISITSSKTFSAGSSIRFDNGLVYGSTGQVINPGTGTLAGTFSGVGSGPFTTDSAVGRAFFITGSQSSSNYTATIRAFDISTFLSVGTIDIPGVNGAISSLVRWGSNGLAFRTDGGQLFLIRTSLVSSADPIPTPTPTVSPTPTPSPSLNPFAAFVRQVPVTNNDIAYNPSSQRFYASVPSSVGSTGNSVESIDPTTGSIGSPVFVGSEPNKLQIADDLQTMYVALDGAAAVRRFDLSTQTPGIQFPIGMGSSFNGPLFANDLAVLPGSPNAPVVARTNKVSSPSSDGVAVYDNAVRRTKVTTNSAFSVETSTNPNRLYSTGSNGGVDRLTVDGTGVTFVDSVPILNGGDIRFDNGLIYGASGGVLDPEAKVMKGSFTGFPLGGSLIMTTDVANGRAFFLSLVSSTATLKAYDLNTFTPVGSVTFSIPNPGVGGSPTRLIRWGTNGLAFRTSTVVFFVQTNLVSSSGSVPAPTPSPSPSPSPTGTPYIPTFVRSVNLPANDLVYRTTDQTLYASVASTAAANGNSISGINPATGSIVSSVFIGSEPNKMAFSDDNRTVHVSLDGAAAIRTFDLETQAPGSQFSWGTANQRPAAMAVVPGSPLALAIADGTSTVTIYDSGVARPNKNSGSIGGVNALAFASPSLLYGYNGSSTSFDLVKMNVDSSGVQGTLIANSLISGFSSGLQFAGGLLYSTGGRVADPTVPALVGTFQAPSSAFGAAFAVDLSLHRIFYVFGSGSALTLSAFDTDTFLPFGSVTLPGISGTPVRLVRWGTNGLALNTGNSSPKQLYLLQSQLVSSAGTIPTSVQMNAANISTFESVGTLNVTVNRTGDVSGTTNVDYATSDGTATAGSDYTATSGTLSFTPGQLTKTIAVPIIDDKVFENGQENFTLTLSNVSGGGLLTSPTSSLITISDNESQPSVSMPSIFRSAEGNSGTKVFTIPVTLSNASVQTVTMSYTTADSTPNAGSATAGSDYVATSGTLTFTPGTTTLPINVTVNGDTAIELDEVFQVRLSNIVNAFGSITQSNVTIANDDSSFQMSAANFSVAESGKSLNVTVTRTGDLSAAASVNYATGDTAGNQNCNLANGKASSRCDYITALGRLNFVANQSSKTITILVIDDGYPEGDETFTIGLANPTLGILGTNATSTITITDNDASLGTNPADVAAFFVRQHYLDFLNREPDQSGLDFWTGQMSNCGASDLTVCRVNVSAAFFVSIEFQQTGYLVERMYKVSYGDAPGTSNLGGPHQLPVPIVRFDEFLQDTQRVGQGVVVNQLGWEQALENNKQAYAFEFVQTSRFTNAFATTMTPAQFVDKLDQNAGPVLSPTERQAVIDLFSGAADSSNLTARAKAVRQVAEDPDLFNAESNRAFVLAQFFGYLRRNPNDTPDTDYTGFEFWQNKLNDFNGNYIAAEMVKAFISSPEYRQRFGQ